MPHGNVLVFAEFVHRTRGLTSRVPGYTVIDNSAPGRRETQVLGNFGSKEVGIITGIKMLAAKFSCPRLSAVILTHPAGSLSLCCRVINHIVHPYRNGRN